MSESAVRAASSTYELISTARESESSADADWDQWRRDPLGHMDKRDTSNSMSITKKQQHSYKRQQKVIRNKSLTLWKSNILQFLEKLLSSVRVSSQTESVGEQSSGVSVFDILNDGLQAWQTFSDDRILRETEKQLLWASFFFEFILCFL